MKQVHRNPLASTRLIVSRYRRLSSDLASIYLSIKREKKGIICLNPKHQDPEIANGSIKDYTADEV